MKNMLKQRFRMLREKKGFTLMEVIIALAIFSIFSLLLCMMFSVVFNMYSRVNKIDRNIDTQTEKIEKGAVVPDTVDTSKFTIEFTNADDIQSSKGKQYADDSTNDIIHIKTFS